MTICQLVNHRFISCLFTVSVLFQLAACDTAQVTDAVAGNSVSNDSSTSDEFLREPDQNITILNSSDTNSTDNSNESITSTASSISLQPTTDDIMYSYNSDLSDARPLSNAALGQTTVYLFSNTSLYSSMRFYCCKGVSGSSIGENHSPSVTVSTAPFIYAIDTSQYTTNGIRELYVDATRANASGYDSITVNFSIQSSTASSQPAPAPAPVSYSDVNLSWVAPSEREDNSGLSLSEIAGYKIYYGTSKGTYPIEISVNDRTMDARTLNLAQGTYYFVMTTLDMDGRESKYSTELKIII